MSGPSKASLRKRNNDSSVHVSEDIRWRCQQIVLTGPACRLYAGLFPMYQTLDDRLGHIRPLDTS